MFDPTKTVRNRVFKLLKKRSKLKYIHSNTILQSMGGKIKDAQNHRQIDARGEAEGKRQR